MDAYGDGEALASVQAKASAAGLALAFHAKRDHLDPSLANYQVRGPYLNLYLTQSARMAGLALAFHAKRDHLDPSLAHYQCGAAVGSGTTLCSPCKQRTGPIFGQSKRHRLVDPEYPPLLRWWIR